MYKDAFLFMLGIILSNRINLYEKEKREDSEYKNISFDIEEAKKYFEMYKKEFKMNFVTDEEQLESLLNSHKNLKTIDNKYIFVCNYDVLNERDQMVALSFSFLTSLSCSRWKIIDIINEEKRKIYNS